MSEMSETEQSVTLEPCPWCGGEAMLRNKPTERRKRDPKRAYWVMCPTSLTTACKVNARTRLCDTPQEAAEQWNTRRASVVVPHQSVDAIIESAIAEASSQSNRGRFDSAFGILTNALRSLGSRGVVAPQGDACPACGETKCFDHALRNVAPVTAPVSTGDSEAKAKEIVEEYKQRVIQLPSGDAVPCAAWLEMRLRVAFDLMTAEIERLQGWQEGLTATAVAWSEQRLSEHPAATSTTPDGEREQLSKRERDEIGRAIAESEIAGCSLENSDIDALVDLFEAWLERRATTRPPAVTPTLDSIRKAAAQAAQDLYALGWLRAAPAKANEAIIASLLRHLPAVTEAGEQGKHVAEAEDVADTTAEIARLTQWQDLCFELLSEIRQWVAPGSIKDTDAPRVLRAMLSERAELRQAAANSPTAPPSTSAAIRAAAEEMAPHLDPYFRLNPDWQEQIAAILSRYFGKGEAVRWAETYAQGIESQNEIGNYPGWQVENWTDFHRGQWYAAKQIAEGLRSATPAAPSPGEPLVFDMQRDLVAAGWVAETAIKWRAPDGSLWRGPYGAWKELRRRDDALRTSVEGESE